MVSCSNAPGQSTPHPTTLSAPVVGYTTATPRSVVAYDDAVGDTILAFGDISAGLNPVLTLQLAQASTIPLSRYLLLEGHLPCTAGSIQPASLRLAVVFGVQFATPPGPGLALVTPTARKFPDIHMAVLATSDGSIRGSCDLIDGFEAVDVTFQQGWNWVRVPPRIGTGDVLVVAYVLTDMMPQLPGADAVWSDGTPWTMASAQDLTAPTAASRHSGWLTIRDWRQPTTEE